MSCSGAYDTLHITGYTKYVSNPITKDLVWCPEAQRKRPSSQHKWSQSKAGMERAMVLNEFRQIKSQRRETRGSKRQSWP